MGPEGVGNKDVTAIAGPASEGMLVTLPADFSADPANAGPVKAFADKKRDANGPFQMPAYAGVKIIADAIAGAKTTDPTKVAAYIHKSAFQTPIGKVDYDAQGDLKSFKFVVFTAQGRHQDRRQLIRRFSDTPRSSPVERGVLYRASCCEASRMNEFLPQFTQQLVNGLTLGAIYALIAIGYTMVYGIIGMINFAHGEIYMIGAYVGLVTLTAIGVQAGYPLPLVLGAALLVSVLVTGLYGFAVERVAYRRCAADRARAADLRHRHVHLPAELCADRAGRTRCLGARADLGRHRVPDGR